MPRKNPLRTALARGRLLRGPFQLLSDPAVTEILLGAGFDFILVDAEHRPLNPETIEHLVRAAHGMGPRKSAVVRVPSIQRGAIQYALETGADGILVPLVRSPEEAAAAVSLCRYPPLGTRGLNGIARAAGWGHPDPGAYARAANRQLVVAVQIETPEALDQVEKIAALKGVDMLYVGPFDFSHGLGLSGQLGHKEVRAAISRVFQVGRRHGKWLGVLAPDRDFATWCVAQGVRFLTYRADVRLLKAAAKENWLEAASIREGK